MLYRRLACRKVQSAKREVPELQAGTMPQSAPLHRAQALHSAACMPRMPLGVPHACSHATAPLTLQPHLTHLLHQHKVDRRPEE